LLTQINHSNKELFNEGLDYSWGTTNTFLGISLQSLLYKKLTGSNEFDSLAIFQRDYVLGKNPWGISFIYNIGTKSSKNLHSQVAFFNKGYLPGGLSAGPAPATILEKYKINHSDKSFSQFNSDMVKYYDDRMDFITNEPTIVGNATALFVFGCYSK
jgi:endoglucanase